MLSATMTQGNILVSEILDAIAESENVDTLDLPPLGEVIDTDALITLLDGESEVVISFRYNGYDVVVDSEGAIEIT